jgi:CBS domain-containing protein
MMSVHLVTCGPETSVREAAGMLTDLNVGSLLVIQGGILRGIFTERDLVRLVAAGADLDVASVGDHATRDVATVPPDTQVDDAAAMMNRLRIRHLPVADGGTPVGMLSLRDFFVLSGAILRAQGADAASSLLRAAT